MHARCMLLAITSHYTGVLMRASKEASVKVTTTKVVWSGNNNNNKNRDYNVNRKCSYNNTQKTATTTTIHSVSDNSLETLFSWLRWHTDRLTTETGAEKPWCGGIKLKLYKIKRAQLQLLHGRHNDTDQTKITIKVKWKQNLQRRWLQII